MSPGAWCERQSWVGSLDRRRCRTPERNTRPVRGGAADSSSLVKARVRRNPPGGARAEVSELVSLGLLGAWVSSEGGNLSEKLPSPHYLLASLLFLPSFLLGSFPLAPFPQNLHFILWVNWELSCYPQHFHLSPAPITKNGVRVSGETKLSSQHLFHPLLLNWPQRTTEEGSPTP